jgi:hypothetical protein
LTLHPLSRRRLLAAGAAGIIGLRPALAQSVSLRESSPMRIRLTFADQDFTATLETNPAARDFLRQLPLDLRIEDYGGSEKIAYLPTPLTEADAGPISDPSPGDICYFAPWGNLAMYHGDYSNYPRLIRLGRLDDGPAPLLTRGTFPLRVATST